MALVAIAKKVVGDKPTKALVGDIEDQLLVAVMCVKHTGSETWEPLYFLHADKKGERCELPQCFELSDEAIHALENAIILLDADA